MSDNLKLWREAFTTDPKAVKPITGKQYSGNSPKPYWLIQRATEIFGPVGIGWGVTVKSERFERMSDTDVLHVAVVSVWYVWGGKRSESFDQMGGTKAAYKTAKGVVLVDEDAGKKSVTDGMVKCLSMIGFAGDIFSGRWDDSKYVAEAAQFYLDKDKPEPPPPPAPFVVEHWLESLGQCQTVEELLDFKDRGMMAAEAAKNKTGYIAIRVEANRLAMLAGWWSPPAAASLENLTDPNKQ